MTNALSDRYLHTIRRQLFKASFYLQKLDVVGREESFSPLWFPIRTRLYLKLSLKVPNPFKPIPVRSLRENHILDISKLGSLPADCPISRVITMSEVITLPIIKSFQLISRILSSKEFPVIIRYVALLDKSSIILATEFII